MGTKADTIAWVQGLDDVDFTELVGQSMKAIKTEPAKWALLLEPELIADTLAELNALVEKATLQAKSPGKFPRAGRFLQIMRSFRNEAEFTMRLRGEG